MEEAIKYYFNKIIKEKIKLENGWKESWLITLSDHQKVVFRAYSNYTELFEREKLFTTRSTVKSAKPVRKSMLWTEAAITMIKHFRYRNILKGKRFGIVYRRN